MVNSIWAVATAQLYDQDLLEFVAHLMQRYPAFVQDFKPQELSNTVWGVATLLAYQNDNNHDSLKPQAQASALSILRSAAGYVQQHGAASFKTQELSNTAWAMATLGFGLTPQAVEQTLNNNYVVLETDDLLGDMPLMQGALDEIVQSSLAVLPRFRLQEFNNMAWSLARLVNTKTDDIEALLVGIGRQLLYPQRSVTSQDIGTTLRSFATLEFVNDDLYR